MGPAYLTIQKTSGRTSIGQVIEWRKQRRNISLAQIERRLGAIGEQRLGKRGLAGLQQFDCGFDSSLHDELVNEHPLVLADAVGTVSCLVFDRRVPPRIIVDHGIGRSQI